MRRRGPSGDTLSLSFVDVLSNGLGAAVLLFLLFAANELAVDAAPVSGPSGRTVGLSWVVSDPAAETSLEIIPPGNRPAVEIIEDKEFDGRAVAGVGRLFASGFGVDGAVHRETDRGERSFSLWVHDAARGEWKFRIRYRNRRSADEWIELWKSDGPSPIVVTSTVTHFMTGARRQIASEMLRKDRQVIELGDARVIATVLVP